jgi:hypothetical protein
MLLSDGADTSAVVGGLDNMIRRLENVTALCLGPHRGPSPGTATCSYGDARARAPELVRGR